MEKWYPIKLKGNFDLGFALGYHTFVGDSKRTPLGEKLYNLKYHNQQEYLDDIVETATNFIQKNYKLNSSDCIIPVPPSKNRDWQPVYLIAEKISKNIKKFFAKYIIRKKQDTPELKNIIDYKQKMEIIKDTFDFTSIKAQNYVKDKKVLLIDDIYDTGATADEISHLLKTKGEAFAVYFLCITKTKASKNE